MKNAGTILIMLLMPLILISCSSTVDRKYSPETVQEDIKLLREELSEDDMKALAAALFGKAFSGGNPEDVNLTYRQLIKEGKAVQAKAAEQALEEQQLAEKARREEAERTAKLSAALTVSCFEKGYYEHSYQKYISYKFAIQNKSDRDIRAIKGVITYTDIFDEEIKSLNFTYDQPIAAGATAKYSATTDYNQFIDSDVALKNKDLKDLTVVWIPEKIIFADGSTLE